MTFREMGEIIAADYREDKISRGEMIQNASDYLVKSLRAENAEERVRLMDLALANEYASYLTR